MDGMKVVMHNGSIGLLILQYTEIFFVQNNLVFMHIYTSCKIIILFSQACVSDELPLFL